MQFASQNLQQPFSLLAKVFAKKRDSKWKIESEVIFGVFSIARNQGKK
jgi:hypothetical protein